MFGLLTGSKTYILVGVSVLAQIFGYVRPEYAPLADKISMGALMGTPATIRMAVADIKQYLPIRK